MTEQAEDYFDFYESIEILETHIPPPLAALRQKLSRKAKQEKRYRFYSLYGNVIAMATLEAAWRQVKANQGAAGVDGITIGDIEKSEGEKRPFLAISNEAFKIKPTSPIWCVGFILRRQMENCDRWAFRQYEIALFRQQCC
jgi:hypothetical protein